MKDMQTVFQFEFSNWIRKKSYWVVTLLIAVVLLIVTSIPTISSLFSGGSAGAAAEGGLRFGYSFAPGISAEEQRELAALPSLQNAGAYESESALCEAVEAGDIDRGICFTGRSGFRMIANDLPLSDTTAPTVASELQSLNQNRYLAEHGMTEEQLSSYHTLSVDYEITTLGSDASTGFLYAYVGIFVIFLLISFYGGFVASMVVREKNDRTMEILVTNTTSSSLIVGKVAAATVLSALQMLLFVLFAALGILLNAGSYPQELLTMLQQGISGSGIAVFLLFGITGTVLYYFLFAAIGALADKTEEADQLLMPARMLFMVAFFLSAACLFAESDGLTRAVSLIPFTSPIAMFVRVVISSVPVTEVLLGYGILLASTALVALCSIRLHAVGVLNYGNRLSLRRAFRLAFQKKQ